MRNWLRAMTFGVATAIAALPSQAETLTDALIAAYRNSNLLDQNQATLRAADEGLAQAVAALRPVVAYTMSAGQRYTQTNTPARYSSGSVLSAGFDLNASMSVYDFGRSRIGVSLARESILATRQALVGVEQQVLLAAVQAYSDVRLSQEIVALRESNVRLIGQELQAAKDRFEVGEITRTDVSIAEAALAEARAGLALAEGNLRVAREAYKAATGSYPGNLAPLPASPATARSLKDAIAVAVRTHPQVRSAQHSVTASDLRVALAEANMKPNVSANAGVSLGHNDPSGRNNFSESLGSNIGLSMNQTIYSGGRLSSLYRAALADKEYARAGLRQTVVQVEQGVGNHWAMIEVYGASIAASRQQIEAAQAAFDGVREEASLGARTTLDVLEAEQDLLDARASRLQAEASRDVAVYQLLSSMGLLTVDHLSLGIPTYDVEAYYNAVKSAPATSSRGKKLDEILQKIGN